MGFTVKLKQVMSKLNENQLSLLSIYDIAGSSSSNDLPFGFGGDIEMIAATGQATGTTLAQKNSQVRILSPIPMSFFNSVFMDSEKVVAFLSPDSKADLNPGVLRILLAHAAFRSAIGEGNCVSQRTQGYILEAKGTLVRIVNGGPMGSENIAYVPGSFAGEKRHGIRSNVTGLSPLPSWTTHASTRSTRGSVQLIGF